MILDKSSFDSATFLKSLPHRAGIYQMFDQQGLLLYVGKARDLKKRVCSYFHKQNLAVKTQSMVAQIGSMSVTVTGSETEALLLESNLIKTLKPKYNILLRDDKSYPYIVISRHEYPRLSVYRGRKQPNERYFGPYPSAQSVRETLSFLQKCFLF